MEVRHEQLASARWTQPKWVRKASQLWAAGGLNATEVNVWRSAAKWNPVSIVGLACGKAGAFHVHWFVPGQKGCPALKQIHSCEQGVMKRNVGRNERRGVKDTVAAVRNEEELQVVWQTCVAARRALHVQQYHKSVINNFIATDAMVWHIYLLTTNDEHLFTGEAWVLCEGKRSKELCDGFSFIQFIQ